MQRTGDAAKTIKVGERSRLTSLSESYAPQLDITYLRTVSETWLRSNAKDDEDADLPLLVSVSLRMRAVA